MTRTTVFALVLVPWACGLVAQGRDQVARSNKGMVVAVHPLGLDVPDLGRGR